MINTLSKTLTLIGCMSLAACAGEFQPTDTVSDDGGSETGGEDDGGVNPVNAKAFYDANVEPLMDAKCASCHGGNVSPVFLTKVNGSSHASILNFGNLTGDLGDVDARILVKGPHSGSEWWTPAEITIIENWFAEEKAAAEGGEGEIETPEGPTAFEAWSGCMSLDTWEETQMGSWAEKQTLQGISRCGDCHGGGLMRFNTNPDSTEMFNANRYEVFIGGFFEQVIDAATGNAIIQPNYRKIERAGNGTTGHPTYRYDPGDVYIQRLQEFYDLTKLAMDNGECGPAGFPALEEPAEIAEE